MKRYAGRMVAVLLAEVVVYEALAIAKNWELISEAVARWRQESRGQRIGIDTGLSALFLHLTRRIDPRFDVFARVARWFGRT